MTRGGLSSTRTHRRRIAVLWCCVGLLCLLELWAVLRGWRVLARPWLAFVALGMPSMMLGIQVESLLARLSGQLAADGREQYPSSARAVWSAAYLFPPVIAGLGWPLNLYPGESPALPTSVANAISLAFFGVLMCRIVLIRHCGTADRGQ